MWPSPGKEEMRRRGVEEGGSVADGMLGGLLVACRFVEETGG